MSKHCHICGRNFGFLENPILKYGVVPVCKKCYEKENSEHFIQSWKKKNIGELVALLGDSDRNNQRYASKFLGILNDNKAVVPLIEALKVGGHDDFITTYNIIVSLGELGDTRALKEVKKWKNKKSIRPEINEIADKTVKKLKQRKFLNMSKLVDNDLKNISWQDFEDKICKLLDAIPNETRTSDMGIDGVTSDGIPIQIKQSERIGRPVIDKFCHAINRYYDISKTKSARKGIIVAFSFTSGAYEEVQRLKLESRLDIELKTVSDLINDK